MRRPSRSGLLLVFVLCACTPLAAQNLESIGREKPFSFAGGLSFNQIFYSSTGVGARRDPYSYVASGNANLSLYGWAIPLAYSISNHQSSFSQPFNRYSLHPTWKWITAHAGYTAMSFSPYTVSGHLFLGGGIDLAPNGNWKVSALYGRFLKAVERDTARGTRRVPSFQRTGYGLKASYETNGNFVNLIVFHAADDLRSIHPLPDSLAITPEQNLVVSAGAGRRVFGHFILKAEVAASAITRDTRAEKAEHHHPLAKAGFLFEPRLSSSYYQAMKTSFDYQQNGWILGVAWERIDPGYRTLGAYYFNNDLENLTVNGSGALLRGKINIAASGGIQHDNLDKIKISTMRRLVGSLNADYTPGQRFNLSASYSSFQTYTNIRPQFETINQLTPYDNLDTLNFTQISRSASLSGMYTLQRAENKRQSIRVNMSWQDAADRQGQAGQNSGTRFYNLVTAYSLSLLPKNITFTAALNGAINDGVFIHTRIWGPNAAITKSLFKGKFRTTFSASYTITNSLGVNINRVFNCRFNGAIAIRRKHNLTVNAVMVGRMPASETPAKSFREFTGSVGYSHRFGGGR